MKKWLFGWWLYLVERHRFACKHENAVADKLEGGVPGLAVQTCHDCGCVRVVCNERFEQASWELP